MNKQDKKLEKVRAEMLALRQKSGRLSNKEKEILLAKARNFIYAGDGL